MTLVLSVLTIGHPAFALTHLKTIDSKNVGSIQLQFDGDVSSNQVKTDFFRDIVQVSVEQSSVHPAQIQPILNEKVKKVFAYQYTPTLVRFRFTVVGSAETYKDKVRVKAEGNMVIVAFVDQEIYPAVEDDPEIGAANMAPIEAVDKVTPLPADTIQVSQSATTQANDGVAPKNDPIKLTSGRDIGNPFRAFGWLAVCLAAFGAAAILLKRFGLKGFFGKILAKRIGNKVDMVEVISTHALGPKQSITIARVAGRLLVLGVTGESIQLITELGENANGGLRASSNQSVGGLEVSDTFTDLLTTAAAKPRLDGQKASVIRERIKSKIEGLKTI